MDNLTVAGSSKNIAKKVEIFLNEEKPILQKFEIGQLVQTNIKKWNGVIFKKLKDDKYWVAFPEVNSKFSHEPCEMALMKPSDFILK